MTPSRAGYLLDEIKRMTRRLENHVLPECERTKGAAYLCELWEELHDTQRALHKTYNELAVMDPSDLEQSNVAA
jgi:hypothetical protein